MSNLELSDSTPLFERNAERLMDNCTPVDARIVGRDIRKLDVLQNRKDGTGNEENTTMYHAMKNAIIIMHSKNQGVNIKNLLEDKMLFNEFYNRYCKPEINEDNAQNLTIPKIRTILRKIITDVNPPQNIEVFHSVAKENNERPLESIATFNFDPRLGILAESDVYSLADATKLYKFAKNPETCSLSCIIGNEQTGRWYTVDIEKDRLGNLHFICCNSNDRSPVANEEVLEICKSLEQQINQIDDFTKDSFTVMRQKLLEGVNALQDEDGVKALMDTTPNRQLANEYTDGSNKEIMLRNLFLSFVFMSQCGWLENRSGDINDCVSELEALMRFYHANLPEGDPRVTKLEVILNEIVKFSQKEALVEDQHVSNLADELSALQPFEQDNAQQQPVRAAQRNSMSAFQPHDYGPFMEIYDSLEQTRNDIKPHHYSLFKLTLNQILTLREDIGSALEGSNIQAAIGDAEFSIEAHSKKDALNDLNAKFGLVKTVYQAAKDNDDLPNFFSCLSTGGVCLNGRSLSIQNYYLSIIGFDPSKVLTEEYYDLAAMVFSGPAESLIDEVHDGDKEALTIEEFVNYMKTGEQISELAEKMKEVAKKYKEKSLNSPQKYEAFLQMLEIIGLYEKDTEPDWEKLLPAFIDSKEFGKTFELALKHII